MITGAFGRARWWFTDRHGGTSASPYATRNLALHVGDDPARVAANRRALADELGLPDPDSWQWLDQVHGAVVIDARGDGWVPQADAAVTSVSGLPMVVMTADCAPLLLVAGEGEAIAVVHAGWSGLLNGVIPAAIDTLRNHSDAPIYAVLGPCIGPDRYAFGVDGLAPLVERFGPAVAARTAHDEPALDVPTAVRLACSERGVASFRDVGICTYESADHFSYRRDKVSGRQALVAVLA